MPRRVFTTRINPASGAPRDHERNWQAALAEFTRTGMVQVVSESDDYIVVRPLFFAQDGNAVLGGEFPAAKPIDLRGSVSGLAQYNAGKTTYVVGPVHGTTGVSDLAGRPIDWQEVGGSSTSSTGSTVTGEINLIADEEWIHVDGINPGDSFQLSHIGPSEMSADVNTGSIIRVDGEVSGVGGAIMYVIDIQQQLDDRGHVGGSTEGAIVDTIHIPQHLDDLPDVVNDITDIVQDILNDTDFTSIIINAIKDRIVGDEIWIDVHYSAVTGKITISHLDLGEIDVTKTILDVPLTFEISGDPNGGTGGVSINVSLGELQRDANDHFKGVDLTGGDQQITVPQVLDDMADVQASTPSEGDVLMYTSGKWRAVATGEITYLADVDVTCVDGSIQVDKTTDTATVIVSA